MSKKNRFTEVPGNPRLCCGEYWVGQCRKCGSNSSGDVPSKTKVKSSNKKLTLVFDIKPRAFQSVRFGKHGPYQLASKKDWVKNISMLARQQLPDGFEMFCEPLFLSTTFAFKMPKSIGKEKRESIERGEIVYKDSRPDVDNLHKGFLDAFNNVLWKDDGQICMLFCKKCYHVRPAIYLTIYPLEVILSQKENPFILDKLDEANPRQCAY